MKFATYIQKRLANLQYDYVFGVPGYYIMPIWDAFYGKKPELILSRHESGAAFMADGWARVRRMPGIVFTTLGPGITNVITGVANAYRDSVPLLILSGQSPDSNFGKGVFQECSKSHWCFYPQDLLKRVTKQSIEINNAEFAVEQFENALKLAITGRSGPVHISLPLDIQESEVKVIFNFESSIRSKLKTAKLTDINCVKAFLNSSKRPVIFAGWGVYCANASADLKIISNETGIPVFSSIKGLACIDNQFKYFVGHIGPGQKSETVDYIKQLNPDLVLVFGANLADYYVGQITELLKKSKVVCVDVDDKQLQSRNYFIDYAVNSDIKLFLKKLSFSYKDNFIFKKMNEHENYLNIDKFRNEKQQSFKNKFMTMKKALSILNTVLEDSCVVIPDAGNHWLTTLNIISPRNVGSIHVNTGLATMGYAIGGSIGIKLAENNRRVYCITGDGSFLMSGNEISVAKDLNLDMVFIVFNNSSLGRVRVFQQMKQHNRVHASCLPEIDFAGLANSLSIKSFKVHTENEFNNVMSKINNLHETILIEVLVDKNEIPSSIGK